MANYTRSTSEERKVALGYQPFCYDPNSDKSALNATSNLKGWCDNPKIEFPFDKQKHVKFWSAYNGTQSGNDIRCGDNQGRGSFDGDKGEIYCDDHFNTIKSSHNVVWCCTWDPYPFAVRGICYNWKTRETGCGWGMGNMWLLYQNKEGAHRFEEITPCWETITNDGLREIYQSKTAYGDRWAFHKNRTATYEHIPKDNVQDCAKGDTWANFQGGVGGDFDKYEELYCIGWAGFYTLKNDAGMDRKHGFYFEDLFLLPEKNTPRSIGGDIENRNWFVGGKCDSMSNIQSRGKRILLQDA